MARYELWYADELGNRKAYIDDVIAFEYTKVLGDIGIGIFQIPRRGQMYDSGRVDKQILVYRQPIGGSLKLDFACYLRKFAVNTTIQGTRYLDSTGVDTNDILKRRIVTDYASSDGASATAEEADDLMKRIFREQMGSSASPSERRLNNLGFSKLGDTTLGPQVTRGFSYRNVLAIFQDLQADSKAAGNEVFFGWTGNETDRIFTTWINQPGVNLTNKVVFSLERGNLSQPKLTYDYLEEANYIYAGGQGTESARIVEEASDNGRIAESRLNWREHFRQSQHGTSAKVQGDADSELELKRPRVTFTAEILDTPQTRYGRDWNVGDRVTVTYAGLQFATIIRSINVKVDANGSESIQTRVEYVG